MLGGVVVWEKLPFADLFVFVMHHGCTGNNIGDEGAIAVAEILKTNTLLTTLDLYSLCLMGLLWDKLLFADSLFWMRHG